VIAALHMDFENLVSIGGQDKLIKIWNLSNLQMKRKITVKSDQSGLAKLNEEQFASGSRNKIRIWRLNDLQHHTLICAEGVVK
jgi:hypothetical protein